MLLIKSLLMVFFVGALVLIAPTGCKPSATNESVSPARTLVTSSLIGTYSKEQISNRYSGAGVALRLVIQYGIKVYRLEYMTTNTDGKTIKASGALLVPADVTKSIPMLSLQHGTITSDDDAPSKFQSSSEAYSYGSLFASLGYIIAAPDYIGYGASKDLPHPYENRNGLATASLDMIRAARDFLSDQKIDWDKRLFIAGYSEGGYATMSLQKKIEEETNGEFNLVASSCGAGAYDKPAFMKQVINEQTAGDDSINRLYVWVLLTYDRIYGLNRPMTYYFKEPYASQIASNGYGTSINASLNTVFTDSFKQAINNGTDKAFLDAVQDNDVHDWKPSTPTQLYHGNADEIVSFLNSQNAYDAMRKRGATNVQLIPVQGGTHGSSIVAFILGTYNFFSDTLLKTKAQPATATTGL